MSSHHLSICPLPLVLTVSLSPSPLSWKAQNCMQHCRGSVLPEDSVEKNGRITSLELLAICFLSIASFLNFQYAAGYLCQQHHIAGSCSSLCSPALTGPFMQPASQWVSIWHDLVLWVYSSLVQALHFLLLTLMRFLLSQSSSLLRSH